MSFRFFTVSLDWFAIFSHSVLRVLYGGGFLMSLFTGNDHIWGFLTIPVPISGYPAHGRNWKWLALWSVGQCVSRSLWISSHGSANKKAYLSGWVTRCVQPCSLTLTLHRLHHCLDHIRSPVHVTQLLTLFLTLIWILRHKNQFLPLNY